MSCQFTVRTCLFVVTAASVWILSGSANLTRATEPPEPVAAPLAQNPQTENAAKVDFQRHIWPVFQQHCNNCHGAGSQEGQLRLDSKTLAMRGGQSGKSIVPGKPAASLLLQRILGHGDHEQMPLDEDPLPAATIAVVRKWLAEGANWPAGVGAADTTLKRHWAYVPPKKRPWAEVSQPAWVLNPVDGFVLARLDQQKLKPSPPALPARLIRRVYLDLTGLPPSVEEVKAFEADPSQAAYQRIVDKLLASPQYGARWAHLWLDLARYADSNGYQADQFRSVWPYRDWVVKAMNDDMPFDQFTIEQLAGDLLPGATISQKTATGFHRLTTCNVEAGVDPEENRVNQVIDRVNTTGFVWLGSSIECAQCHNHKYDPFTQRDYYQLFAYFNNTPLEVEGNGVTYNFTGPRMTLPLSPAKQQQRAALQADYDELASEVGQKEKLHLQQFAQWQQQHTTQTPDRPPVWHVIKNAKLKSAGGATPVSQNDGSILLTGANPETDIYTVGIPSKLQDITGVKIETLTHRTLPRQGPGRGVPNPNIILNSITAEVLDAAGAATPAVFTSAKADFEQKGWAVAGAIDNDAKTGWAISPRFGKPHHAEFYFKTPLNMAAKSQLVLKLDQHYGGSRTIGRLRVSLLTGKPAHNSLPADILNVLKTPEGKRKPAQLKQLQQYYLSLDPAVKRGQAALAKQQARIDAIAADTTLVMVERKPRKTHIFRRGEFQNKGQQVSPATPQVLHGLPEDAPQNRLGLARWIASPRNPLTGRVVINRWWAQFFGAGLVPTQEDFGAQGDAPSHPQLLDWLAREFADSGWSRKHMHKLIVMSNTYRQSSRVTPHLLAADPGNRLLARGARFRLNAEMIRDNALTISGLLSRKQNGPPVYPPQPPKVWRHVGRNAPPYNTSQGADRFRRGVYVVWRRSAPYPSFVNFDAPDRASCVVARPRTNTPLQALTLLNDPAYIEMAQSLAERIDTDHTQYTDAQKAAYGFRRAVARQATPQEQAHLLEVFETERKRLEQQPQQVQAIAGNNATASRAAWVIVSTVLLNLDETITRN